MKLKPDIIYTKVNINDKVLEKRMDDLIDDKTMTAIHNLFAKMCDPYVPLAKGHLSQTIQVSAKGVHYTQPYAHYMYEGIVYGPNYPIIEKGTGTVVGWYSPKDQKKHPTGAKFQYNHEHHPKATHHWDKAMIEENREKFEEGVKNILIWRNKQLYG